MLIALLTITAQSALAGGIDANTVLYLDFESATGQSATDLSSSNHTINFTSTATVEQTTTYSGTGNVFSVNTGNITIPYSNDFNIGQGDFTIDLKIKLDSTSRGAVFTRGLSNGALGQYWLEYGGSRGWDFAYYHPNGSAPALATALDVNGADPIVGQWTHVAVVRDGTDLKLYHEGILIDEVANFANYASEPTNGDFTLGYWSAVGTLPGQIDDFRISKGIARTTDSSDPLYITDPGSCTIGQQCFTPPAQSYALLGQDSPEATVSNEIEISTANVTVDLNTGQTESIVSALQDVQSSSLEGLTETQVTNQVESALNNIIETAKAIEDTSSNANDDLARATVIITALENFTEVVNDATPQRDFKDEANKIAVSAKKIDATGDMTVSNGNQEINLSNVPEGNTLVVATAEKDSAMPAPAGVVGDLIILEMKDENGNEITSGFSIDLSIEKVGTTPPSLVRLNEDTGEYETVAGVTVNDGGTTWDFTLTSFSTYAFKGDTNKLEDAFNATTNSNVKSSLEYADRFADNPQSTLANKRRNARAINQARAAAKAAALAQIDTNPVIDAIEIITGKTATTIKEAYEKIRQWRKENKYR